MSDLQKKESKYLELIGKMFAELKKSVSDGQRKSGKKANFEIGQETFGRLMSIVGGWGKFDEKKRKEALHRHLQKMPTASKRLTDCSVDRLFRSIGRVFCFCAPTANMVSLCEKFCMLRGKPFIAEKLICQVRGDQQRFISINFLELLKRSGSSAAITEYTRSGTITPHVLTLLFEFRQGIVARFAEKWSNTFSEILQFSEIQYGETAPDENTKLLNVMKCQVFNINMITLTNENELKRGFAEIEEFVDEPIPSTRIARLKDFCFKLVRLPLTTSNNWISFVGNIPKIDPSLIEDRKNEIKVIMSSLNKEISRYSNEEHVLLRKKLDFALTYPEKIFDLKERLSFCD